MEKKKVFETIKKVLYAGVGTAAIAGGKIKETIDDLVKRGDLTEQDGKELIETYMGKLTEERKHLTTVVQEQVEKQLLKLKLVKVDDHEKLIQEVEDLK